MPVAERYAEGEAEYAELSNTPADLQIEVQKVRHPSRVHLDIETDDLDAEAARLEALGARKIEFRKRWWIMEAPTGQRFCIVRMKHPERGAPPIRPDERRHGKACVSTCRSGWSASHETERINRGARSNDQQH